MTTIHEQADLEVVLERTVGGLTVKDAARVLFDGRAEAERDREGATEARQARGSRTRAA
ncbi:MAG: hypothetical protein H0U46_07785 [Actinobacteria bacterium]|nr:hypothetical protein [Actinomycetota bacterium]